MTINKQSLDNGILLSVEGRIDSITGLEFQDALITALNEYMCVTLDFGGVTYISSAGLRVILMACKIANGESASFKIANASDEIMEIFDMTGFSDFISINE